MKGIFETVMSMYDSYNGNGMQMALFFACLFYLALQKKENEKRVLFLGYTLLFFIICFFPVTAKIIMDFCIGEEVYWRMFWLLPSVIVTSYTGVLVIMRAEGNVKRYALLFMMFLVIGMTGTIVYNSSIFERKQNNYKLPQEAVDVCDIIEADAAANGITHKKLIAANDLVAFIRQYDADILMPYGMDAVRGHRIETERAAEIFRIMSSDQKDWESLAWFAAAEDCNYLAYPKEEEISGETPESYGYQLVGASAAYHVYRRDVKETDYDGEWMVTQYGGADGEPLMFYTVEDQQGHLIVIDGGCEEDADFVRKRLQLLGGHVDAWILTHPHKAHVGAFIKLFQKSKKIQIDTVYAVDFSGLDAGAQGEESMLAEWSALEIEQLRYVKSKDTFDVAGLSFEVLHAWDGSGGEDSKEALHDGSMMFRISANTESMLFCADVGKRIRDSVRTQYKEALASDYIQMPNHGNSEPDPDFYKAVGAKAAFFDAPKRMMQEEGGAFLNRENACRMYLDGTAVYSYETTPNRIILK